MPLTDKRYKVYRHTNKVNGKVYIGITKQSVERRWQNGKGYDRTYFGNAIRKYGWDSFEHSVLISGVDKETACFIEKTLIALYKSNTRECGYNICEGGQTGDNLSPHCGEDNCRATSVKRIDPKTNEVVIYRTVNEAAISMGINHRGISKACRDKQDV